MLFVWAMGVVLYVNLDRASRFVFCEGRRPGGSILGRL